MKLICKRSEENCSKGSSYGWVVTIEDTRSDSPTDMYLIHQLRKARIILPPRNKFPDVKRYRANKVGKEYVVFLHDCFDTLFAGFDADDCDSDGSDSDILLLVQDSHCVGKTFT